MSLREEAIKAYREKKVATEAKQVAEKKKGIDERLTTARERICKAFALTECPPLVVTQVGEFWPEVAFEVEGIVFFYAITSGRIEVKMSCPKCGHEWHNVVRTDESGVRDLSDLGFELCGLERHNCPKDKPPYVPSPPPKTVEYRLDGTEHQLLEAIREYVDAAVEERMGDR